MRDKFTRLPEGKLKNAITYGEGICFQNVLRGFFGSDPYQGRPWFAKKKTKDDRARPEPEPKKNQGRDNKPPAISGRDNPAETGSMHQEGFYEYKSGIIIYRPAC
jgi:hypothetical protein